MKRPLFHVFTFCSIIIMIMNMMMMNQGWAQLESRPQSNEQTQIYGQIPQDWFILPEHSEQSEKSRDTLLEAQEGGPKLKRAGENFHKILEEQKIILDRIPTRKSSWTLLGFTTQLALAYNGIIGFLSQRGAFAFQLLWFRSELLGPRPQPLIDPGSVPDSGNPPSLPEIVPPLIPFHAGASMKKLQHQLEPIILRLIASGKVSNEKTLRTNFFQQAFLFQQLIEESIVNPATASWFVQRISWDLQISSSGEIIPFMVSVGGSVRVRFSWRAVEAPTAFIARPSASEDKPPSTLRKFVGALQKNIELLEEFSPPFSLGGHPLAQVSLRFGLSAFGSIFLARSAISSNGQITFARRKSHPPTIVPTVTSSTMDIEKERGIESHPMEDYILIEGAQIKDEMEFAKNKGITYTLENLDESQKAYAPSLKRVLYKVPRSNLLQGLKKSISISSFFIHKAARIKPGSRWTLVQISPSFSVSLTGLLGLAGVSGNSSVVLNFSQYNTEP